MVNFSPFVLSLQSLKDIFIINCLNKILLDLNLSDAAVSQGPQCPNDRLSIIRQCQDKNYEFHNHIIFLEVLILIPCMGQLKCELRVYTQ